MANLPNKAKSGNQLQGKIGWGALLIAVVAALILTDTDTVPRESIRPTEDTFSAVPPEPAALATAASSATSPPVVQAVEHVQRAIGALGALGARTYSENCYAFLVSTFSTETARRSTMRKARITLARRLAIIMHAMLRHGTTFQPA